MKNRRVLAFVLTVTIMSLGLSAARAAESEPAAVKITRAMSAAPSMVSAGATIIDDDGTVLREGTNNWVCAPNTFPGDGFPMCGDEVWQGWLTAFKAGKPFSSDRMGISYMLMGDGGVSNSNPMHPNPSEAPDFIKEGAHLMIILPTAMLAGMSDDPHSGDPYVMWKDTPYVHVMVPIEDRPHH